MLTGKYATFAEYFGNDVAEGIFKADISTAKKKGEIQRLKKKLLELPNEDVGAAYKHIAAQDVGISNGEAMKTESSWKAENIILRTQILEMEI
nr:MAG TPA: hypothetical protein [Caudoviricetes sp.]